ncbi:CLUMA_CG013750, isoform A [Clunio marinus]|uniref:trypsin n=1 Tax=Clunio marinus TaxID=568069 RepID=A0A1J1IPR0_9DIPT|nr:CLUMA_CG013750, isoform A [Clunio marinus]
MKKFLLQQAVIIVSLMINFTRAHRFGIIGGAATDIESFPFAAAFLVDNKFKCGSSIISENCALTAAHCVQDLDSPARVQLRVGSTFKNEGGQIIQADNIISHPNYDRLKLNMDFAIIKWKTSLQFEDSVDSVELAGASETLADGTECIVCGWGRMRNDTRTSQLRSVSVYKVNQEICQKDYNSTRVKFHIVEGTMICAGVNEGGKDACAGDSGGPLICNSKQFGVVSSGYGCGLPEYPGIYAFVPTIHEWINEHCAQ